MTVQFTDPATALAHIEAYMNGGDELGIVPEADAVAALAYLRLVTAPQPVTEPATVAAAVEAALRQLYIAVGQYGMRLNGPEEKEAALRNAGRVLAALANSKDSQSENGKDKK